MAFQQELLQLIDSFSLRSVADFERLPPNEKHYFVTRLYKCFEKALSSVSHDLRGHDGLKLGYERELTERRNLFEDVTLKKLAFYSSHAVVTCPIEEIGSPVKSSKSKRMDGRERLDSATIKRLREEGRYVLGDVKANQRSHGGEIHVEGKAYIVDRTGIAKLIESIIGLRDALAQGVVHVLPCWPDAKLKLRSDLRKAGVVPGNFSRQSLVRQFTEGSMEPGSSSSDVGMFPIYLPHVTNLSLREIVDVRQAESAAYDLFQSALVNCVFTPAGEFSEAKLEEYLKQIDGALRKIRAQMEQLRRRYNFKNRDTLIKTLVLGVVALAPTGLSPTLAPLFSSYTLFDYFSNRTDFKTAVSDAASGEFFVLWRLDEIARNRKGN